MKILARILKFTFILYIISLFFFSLYSFKDLSVNLSDRFLGIKTDKIVHFIIFFPFSFLSFIAFGAYLKRKINNYCIFVLFIFGIIISTITETLQILTPLRSFELLDLLANYIGIFIGSLLLYIIVNSSKYNRVNRLL